MESENNSADTGAGEALTHNEIMEQCRMIARKKVNEVTELNLPFMDTEYGRAIFEEQIYGILLQMLSFVGANMQKNRKQKQRQGIEAAKAAGVQLGRRRKYEPEKYLDIYRQLENGDISINTALSSIGACRTTFDKMRKELRERGLL